MAETLNWDELRELAEFRAEKGCAISFYVDLDPSITPTAGDADARVNALLSEGERNGNANHRGFQNFRMAYDGILEFDGRDPLATRLDDILRTVGDLGVAALVDGAHIAGAQPPIVKTIGRRIAEVRGRDPWATGLEFADRLAIPG